MQFVLGRPTLMKDNYIGCFQHALNTLQNDDTQVSTNTASATIDWCVNLCQSKGFLFAGLQVLEHIFRHV